MYFEDEKPGQRSAAMRWKASSAQGPLGRKANRHLGQKCCGAAPTGGTFGLPGLIG